MSKTMVFFLVSCGVVSAAATAADIKTPIMFDTPEADASWRPCRSFRPTIPGTRTSPTGRCTRTRRTSSPRSAPTSRCATTPTWASSSCRRTRSGWTVKIVGYPDESDKGPYPVPDNMPIEGWPVDFQRDPQHKT